MESAEYVGIVKRNLYDHDFSFYYDVNIIEEILKTLMTVSGAGTGFMFLELGI